MYIIGVFAVANLARASLQIKTLALKILLVCICVGAGVFAYSLMINRAIEYVVSSPLIYFLIISLYVKFIAEWGSVSGRAFFNGHTKVLTNSA